MMGKSKCSEPNTKDYPYSNREKKFACQADGLWQGEGACQTRQREIERERERERERGKTKDRHSQQIKTNDENVQVSLACLLALSFFDRNIFFSPEF